MTPFRTGTAINIDPPEKTGLNMWIVCGHRSGQEHTHFPLFAKTAM